MGRVEEGIDLREGVGEGDGAKGLREGREEGGWQVRGEVWGRGAEVGTRWREVGR